MKKHPTLIGLHEASHKQTSPGAPTEVWVPTTDAARTAYRIPWPTRHMQPHGIMPATNAAAGLWYFLLCAHQAVHTVPNQITVTDEEDVQVNLNNVARSVSMVAGVTLQEMFDPGLWRAAQAEAKASDMALDHRVKSFIETGGQVAAKYDRDPDAHT